MEKQKKERDEEENLLRLERERKEALTKLKALRSKRQSLETLLPSPPSGALGSKATRRAAQAPYKEKSHTAIPTYQTSCHWNPGKQQTGELNDLNSFAIELLDSVRQLKDRNSNPFSLLMTKAMSGRVEGVRKADSLCNVNFEREFPSSKQPEVLGEVTFPVVKHEPQLQKEGPSSSGEVAGIVLP